MTYHGESATHLMTFFMKGACDALVSTILSATLTGLYAEPVRVEADVTNGMPGFHMVGYLSSEVKEAGERVRSAIRNSGIDLPVRSIIVNLSPADVKKRGTVFDLPIAAAILMSASLIPNRIPKGVLMVGELGLDGTVRGVAGVLPIVLAARKQGVRICVVPKENEEEGELAEGVSIVGIRHLSELCGWISKGCKQSEKKKIRPETKAGAATDDYKDVKGQKLLKRATQIAVAGEHNLLMIGPPGVGKTMVAKRIPSILPPLTRDESMELTAIYSIAGELDSHHPLVGQRPYREVHHSVTRAALLGGGTVPRPGEVTLAEHGVLFLDELAEFPRQILESLRQPIENDSICILRGGREYRFPTKFLLVAAMNPCPCGNYPDLNRCNCTQTRIRQYRGKISSPILDRFDLCVEAQKVPYEQLKKGEDAESSETIRKRILQARKIQKERYHTTGIRTNAGLSTEQVKTYCSLGEEEENLMEAGFKKWNLTARTYYKVLKVARTIADLAESEDIRREHLLEAFAYRPPADWSLKGVDDEI